MTEARRGEKNRACAWERSLQGCWTRGPLRRAGFLSWSGKSGGCRLRPNPKRRNTFRWELSDHRLPFRGDFFFQKAAGVSAGVLLVVLSAVSVGDHALGERWTPESPDVVQAVDRDRGLFGEAAKGKRRLTNRGLGLGRTGAAQEQSPRGSSARNAGRRRDPQANSFLGRPQDFSISTWDIYSTGLSLIFLCSYVSGAVPKRHSGHPRLLGVSAKVARRMGLSVG